MDKSADQLNHALKTMWPDNEHIPGVEARYLRVIHGLIAYIGGEVTLSKKILTADVDFMVEQDDRDGTLTLRTKEFNEK